MCRETACTKLCCCWFGLVVAGLIIGVVMFIIFPFAGVLIVAMTPAVAIMGLARHVYGDQVTVGQMVVSFFETILWMLPLLLWDLIWFAILISMNLQTSFLTPPFGFSLFYLKGVAPSWLKTSTIYKGVMPFILIQIAVLCLVLAFPEYLIIF